MNDDWEKNDPLWELLGHAKPVSVSPFFARNVVREIRQAPARPLIPAFLLRWMAAGAFAVLTAGFIVNLGAGDRAPSPTLTKSADFTAIFDEVAGLDALVAVEDVSISNYTADL
jgi:hypothetical protein